MRTRAFSSLFQFGGFFFAERALEVASTVRERASFRRGFCCTSRLLKTAIGRPGFTFSPDATSTCCDESFNFGPDLLGMGGSIMPARLIFNSIGIKHASPKMPTATRPIRRSRRKRPPLFQSSRVNWRPLKKPTNGSADP